MKTMVLLASIAAVTLTAATAEAKQRRGYYDPWEDAYVYYEDEDDAGYYVEDDYDDEVIILNSRKKRMREAEQRVEEELWWMEERAHKRLEKRKAQKSAGKKTIQKPKVVAAKPKPVQPAQAEIKTASLSKAPVVTKAKPVALTQPKTDLQKPKATPKAVAGKSIGCTAGAAVITGYGFGDVKPKVCTGNVYAYSAARAGKAYEIKLTAASGEITDVKKLN
jgi:hypothetical protein